MSTGLTAARPPKFLVSPLTCSIGLLPRAFCRGPSSACRGRSHQPFGHEEDDGHEDDREEEGHVGLQRPRHLRKQSEDGRPDDGADEVRRPRPRSCR